MKRFDHEEWTGRLLGAAHLIKFFQKLFLDACFFSRPRVNNWAKRHHLLLFSFNVTLNTSFLSPQTIWLAFLPSCVLSRRLHHTSLLLWQNSASVVKLWNGFLHKNFLTREQPSYEMPSWLIPLVVSHFHPLNQSVRVEGRSLTTSNHFMRLSHRLIETNVNCWRHGQ